jgi:non-ribosomal peptide synthetase component F
LLLRVAFGIVPAALLLIPLQQRSLAVARPPCRRPMPSLPPLPPRAAFLPVDPGWPPAQLEEVLGLACPAALVYDGGPPPPPPAARRACPPASLRSVEEAGALSRGGGGGGGGEPGEGPPGQLLYALFTSGSTGAPLGALGTQRGFLNRWEWMQAARPLRPGDRVALSTAPAFVDHVWEALAPLLAGADVVVLPEGWALRPAAAAEALARHGVTHLVRQPLRPAL